MASSRAASAAACSCPWRTCSLSEATCSSSVRRCAAKSACSRATCSAASGSAQLGRDREAPLRTPPRRSARACRASAARSCVLLQRELGVGAHVADDDQRIARAHALSLADEDLAHDAAFLVLDGLAVQLDLDLRRCDHGAGDRRERGPRREGGADRDERHRSAGCRQRATAERSSPSATSSSNAARVEVVAAAFMRRLRSQRPGRGRLARTLPARRPGTSCGSSAAVASNATRRRPSARRSCRAATSAPAGGRPRSRSCRAPSASSSAARSASSPSASRLALGSSSTTRRGLAVERAGERDALALAAREQRAAVADRRVVALRQAQDHVVRVRERAASTTRSDRRPRPGARCSRRPCRRTARRPAAGSRRARRARRGPSCAMSAPSRRTLPDCGFQIPSSKPRERRLARRARADQAEALAGVERELRRP